MRRLPDFFIVGAPKCGTTALYHYLSQHPSIYMPALKEPHFFCRDFPSFGKIHDMNAYLDLFDDAPDDAVLGEASVWYLYSKCAIPRIMAANPCARIIVMLRNPVTMARSLHRQLILSMREDIEDFEAAWRAQRDRKSGTKLPLYCPEPSHLQYGDVCRHAGQVERLLGIVPLEQVKILIYEEFFEEVQVQYNAVTQFLNVACDGRTVFPQINAAREPRSHWLWNLIRRPPFPLNRLHRPAQHLARALGLRIVKLMNEFDSQTARKKPSNPEFERELFDYFSDDVAALERLLGRPLSAWKTASASARGQVGDDLPLLRQSSAAGERP